MLLSSLVLQYLVSGKKVILNFKFCLKADELSFNSSNGARSFPCLCNVTVYGDTERFLSSVAELPTPSQV
jgi:hypothetical protein